MIRELHEYIGGFRCPSTWGDPNSDIDWKYSYFNPNLTQLFMNVVGGKRWQPRTHYPGHISNLYFAGDCVLNEIRMTTVESAVVSGLHAAREVWKKHKLGEAINVVVPETYPLWDILALDTLMLPWACAAKWWSSAAEVVPSLRKGDMTAARASMAIAMAEPYLMVTNWWAKMAWALVR
jgi:hypothetical protein